MSKAVDDLMRTLGIPTPWNTFCTLWGAQVTNSRFYLCLSVISFAMAVLWLVALCSCTRVIHPQPSVVSITYKPVVPSCYISDMPEAPELLELNYEDDDIIRRTAVHYLTGNQIIQFERDLATWASEVRSCLYAMQGVEP